MHYLANVFLVNLADRFVPSVAGNMGGVFVNRVWYGIPLGRTLDA